MFHIATKALFFSFFSITLFAQTPFVLKKISAAHIVVKSHNNKMLNKYRTDVYDLLYEYLDDLNISVSNVSQRVFGIDMHLLQISQESSVVELELYMHEPALRIEDNQEIFSISYQNRHVFVVNDLEEDLEDNVITLLEEFNTQYEEDNE